MLTDLQVKNAPVKERVYRIPDGQGLYVVVYPTGSKLLQVRYRLDGKERIASLGRYDEVGLKKARLRRDRIRAGLQDGS